MVVFKSITKKIIKSIMSRLLVYLASKYIGTWYQQVAVILLLHLIKVSAFEPLARGRVLKKCLRNHADEDAMTRIKNNRNKTCKCNILYRVVVI